MMRTKTLNQIAVDLVKPDTKAKKDCPLCRGRGVYTALHVGEYHDATYCERVMNIGLVENTRLALMSSDVSAINGKIKAMEDWIKCAKAQAPLIAGQCKRWNEGLRLMQEVYEDTKDSSYTFYLE